MISSRFLHRHLVLDLRHDADAAAPFLDFPAQQFDVGGAAHERHGDEIHVALEGELEVRVILLGQRGQLHVDAGQVDVAAAAHRPGREHFADEFVVALLDRAHAQQAVVDDDDPAHVDVVDQVGIIARRS